MNREGVSFEKTRKILQRVRIEISKESWLKKEGSVKERRMNGKGFILPDFFLEEGCSFNTDVNRTF